MLNTFIWFIISYQKLILVLVLVVKQGIDDFGRFPKHKHVMWWYIMGKYSLSSANEGLDIYSWDKFYEKRVIRGTSSVQKFSSNFMWQYIW